MAGKNNFYPYGESSTNILNNSEYQTDQERTAGAARGAIARSKIYNKALRQSAAGAYAVADLVAAAGKDADDASAATLAENFRAAVSYQARAFVASAVSISGGLATATVDELATTAKGDLPALFSLAMVVDQTLPAGASVKIASNLPDTDLTYPIYSGGEVLEADTITAGAITFLVDTVGEKAFLNGSSSGKIPTNKFLVKVTVTSYNGGEVSGRTIAFTSPGWAEQSIVKTDSTGTATAELDYTESKVTASVEDVPDGYQQPADITITPVGGKTFSANFFMAERTFTPIIYGVKIAKNNSNPKTAVTYTDDAVGLSPSYTNGTDTFVDNGWQERLEQMVGMKPCVLKDGVVQYYLNPNDYTKKSDGGSADITSGNDGDVMVEFTKCWMSITSDSSYVYVRIANYEASGFTSYPFRYKGVTKDKFYVGAYAGYVADGKLRSLSGKSPTISQTIDTFRTQAQANGAGYEMVPYNKLILLQVLYLIRFKSLNSQTALGKGIVDSNSKNASGATNTKGMCFGNTSSNDVNIKCNGIEDLWGNWFEYIDGLYSTGSGQILTSDGDFANMKGVVRTTFSGVVSKFTKNVYATAELGFLISSADGGSSTTYYCDYGQVNGGCITYYGGYEITGNSGNAGVFNVMLYIGPAAKQLNTTARLSYCG